MFSFIVMMIQFIVIAGIICLWSEHITSKDDIIKDLEEQLRPHLLVEKRQEDIEYLRDLLHEIYQDEENK